MHHMCVHAHHTHEGSADAEMVLLRVSLISLVALICARVCGAVVVGCLMCSELVALPLYTVKAYAG